MERNTIANAILLMSISNRFTIIYYLILRCNSYILFEYVHPHVPYKFKVFAPPCHECYFSRSNSVSFMQHLYFFTGMLIIMYNYSTISHVNFCANRLNPMK